MVRFDNLEGKNQIWKNLKEKPPIVYEGREIQIFQDLSQDTLRRRRTLKPLLKTLQDNGLQYNWGFPACLNVKRNGRTIRLRFPEEIPEFCKKLEIPLPKNPEETTKRTDRQTGEETQWQLVHRK